MTRDCIHQAHINLIKRDYRSRSGEEYSDPKVLAAARRIEIDGERHRGMVQRHRGRYYVSLRERLDPFDRFSAGGMTSTDPAKIVEAKEELERMSRYLASLDSKAIKVLRLRHSDGQSLQSIARTLCESKGAINSRLARGRRRLRRELSPRRMIDC